MRHWTTSEERTLRELYHVALNTEIAAKLNRTVPSVTHRAIKLGLRKPDELVKSRCRLQPGHATWNKGRKHSPAGSEAARFKPGNLPHNHRQIGAERVTKDGVLERKVTDTRSRKDWRPVKDLMWEEHHGPIPPGHIVVVADRDKAHLCITNLLCITKAENMRRNSIHRTEGAASDMQRKSWQRRKAKTLPLAHLVGLVRDWPRDEETGVS